MSRFMGGIHYKTSVFVAFDQGKKVGDLVMERLKFLKSQTVSTK